MTDTDGPPNPPSADNPSAPRPEDSPTGPRFPIVGVGASAGGLEAFTELLEALPPDPGLAFLFVSHLDPHHKSHLPEILGKVTPDAGRARSSEGHGGRGQPRLPHPAGNTNMALTDGRLTPHARAAAPAPHMPIDHLFRSLAEHPEEPGHRRHPLRRRHRRHAGLPGRSRRRAASPSPRTRGRPSTTSMPRSAVLDGNVDYVLRPRDIARAAGCASPATLRPRADPAAEPPPAPAGEPVDEIIGLLRAAHGRRFHPLQADHHRRRILRRMALRGLEDPRDYLRLLRGRRRRGAQPVPGLPDPRHPVLPRSGGVRGPQGEGLPAPGQGTLGRLRPSASGWPAAPPARRSTRWPSACWSTWTSRPEQRYRSRSWPPTSTRPPWRRPAPASTSTTSRSTCRRNGCGASSSGQTATTRSARRSATCASSRGTTWPATRRSAGSTWSAAATC